MLTEQIRPMTEMERKKLQDMLDSRPTVAIWHAFMWVALWLGALSLVIVAIYGVIAAVKLADKNKFCTEGVWILIAIAGGIVAVLVIFGLACIGWFCLCAIFSVSENYSNWRDTARRYQRETVPVIEAALQSGNVLSKDIRATSVIEIDFAKAFWPIYLFDIGNGESLLLDGLKYRPVAKGTPWPCTEFQIVRSVDGKLLVGLFYSGVKLEPYRTVNPWDYKEDFIALDDREKVFGKSPEEVLRDMLKPVDARSEK